MPTILVIDDDSIIIETLKMLLESRGHSVLTAEDGQEGLELCATTSPDLVFTDILMPNCEGIEVIRTLRKSSTETKIVAMSGGGLLVKQDILRLAHRMGADRVLPKPFSADQVFSILEEVLGASTGRDTV